MAEALKLAIFDPIHVGKSKMSPRKEEELHALDSVARADEWRVFKRTPFATTITFQS